MLDGADRASQGGCCARLLDVNAKLANLLLDVKHGACCCVVAVGRWTSSSGAADDGGGRRNKLPPCSLQRVTKVGAVVRVG